MLKASARNSRWRLVERRLFDDGEVQVVKVGLTQNHLAYVAVIGYRMAKTVGLKRQNLRRVVKDSGEWYAKVIAQRRA